MAKITIENAVVDRVFTTQYGAGVAVHETFEKKDGTEGKSYYTLWMKEEPDLEEGQVVSASGFLGTKIREYTDRDGNDRQTVDVSVRGARLIGAARPVPPAPETGWSDEPLADAWGGGEQF